MKIKKDKLKQIILEELEAVTFSEERGEYQIREVRNSFSRWKEKSIDNRIANCK